MAGWRCCVCLQKVLRMSSSLTLSFRHFISGDDCIMSIKIILEQLTFFGALSNSILIQI
jgi:hypothetical protein